MSTTKEKKQTKTRKRLSPEERKQQILDCANEIIVREGFAKFSLRYVASCIGIRLSSVQYYFPTKEALFHAAFEDAIEKLTQKMHALTEAVHKTPEEKLRTTLKIHITANKDKDVNGLFYQLWAQAYLDDFASDLMDRFYKKVRQPLIDAIKEYNPKHNDESAERVAFHIASTLEGLMLFTGKHRRKYPGLKNMEEFVLQQAMDLAAK